MRIVSADEICLELGAESTSATAEAEAAVSNVFI